MRAEDEAMCVEVARLGDVREPLCSKRRPFKSVCYDKIVEKRRIFLPDLVLFGKS